jgi:dihydrofolate reductase
MMVSLDGYIEDSEKNIEWHRWNTEMDQYMGDFFKTVDTIIMGRKTYELMVSYWPDITTEDPVITDNMNNLPKLIFSKTMTTTSWNNCRLMHEINIDEFNALKMQPGKDMVIFGGANLASAFTKKGLIDEFRLLVNPVILGGGTHLFNIKDQKFELFLMESKAFNCGNVLLHYQSGHQ